MPRAFFSDSFNDIHELKYGQAEEKLEAGGDEKLIFNFIWPNIMILSPILPGTKAWIVLLVTVPIIFIE